MAGTYVRDLPWPFALPPTIFSVVEDWEDVYALTSNLTVDASSPWIGTALNTGTMLQTGANTGNCMVLSGAATTDNSGVQIQTGTSGFSMPGTVGFQVGGITRFKLSDGTQDEALIALATVDTTLLDGTGTLAGMTHTYSFGIYKPDGTTHPYLYVNNNSTLVNSVDLGAVDFTSYHVLAFRYVATTTTSGSIEAWIDSTQVASATCSSPILVASADLRPSLAFNTGDASGTKTMTNDFIGFYQSRAMAN